MPAHMSPAFNFLAPPRPSPEPMKTKQGSTLQSLRTVQLFLDSNADRLSAVNTTGARRQLDALIVALDGHVATQAGSHLIAMGLTQKQYALREALLRDHMAMIARIAAATLSPTEELIKLRMPIGRPTVERLAAAAHGMAQAAEPFAAAFVSDGMPVNFMEQLTGAADALVSSMTDRTNSRGSRRGATKGLETTLSRGRKIVHVLDAFVKSALRDEPSLLANWNVVKRVRIIATHSRAMPNARPLGFVGGGGPPQLTLASQQLPGALPALEDAPAGAIARLGSA